MPVREPVVAGQFYPDSAEQCWAEVDLYLSASPPPAETGQEWLGHPVGGIVPHAGWMCSGAVAAKVIKLLIDGQDIETCVIFGAMHRLVSSQALLFSSGSWRMPIGAIEIDEVLASAVLNSSSQMVNDPAAHRLEHSIEVQVPFIQRLCPNVKLLPIMVPPTTSAFQLGHTVAQQIQEVGRNVVYMGSSDLTHYGPGYHFTPQGIGDEALQWAKGVNDRRIIDLMIDMCAEKIVDESGKNHNACGSGAIAATIAACKTAGAKQAKLIEHTTSVEVLEDRLGKMEDSVGYAGVIFYQPSP
ncbi:MAG: AmmeMemoRadiSam system protein B [Planctomycetota bacterium]|nr:MAG: AmmeMemoRadiSam system protein B [Planctomycetota bacterium]